MNQSDLSAKDLDNDLERYEEILENIARKRSRKSEDDDAI